MRNRLALVLVLGSAVVFVGCGDDGESTGIPDACNPLGGTACMMPWPSSIYLDDAATATGFLVNVPFEAMPTSQDDRTIDPELFRRYDGFALSAPIVVAFDTGVSADGLPPHSDPGASHQADASIVVLNMETRERLTIFAEPDMNADDPTERALVIRPLERMQPGTRYAVAVRKSVKAANGSELPIPPGFQAILDDADFAHPLFEKASARHATIFEALEADGIPRTDLVLAWDFVTGSDENVTEDLLAMRALALPVIGATGDSLTFDFEEESGDPSLIYKLYTGAYDVPMFLDAAETDLSVLMRGADGLPQLNGTARANFAAVVPACVQTEPLPIPVIIFGHGLFGDAADSVDMRFLQEVANDNCAVIIGGDFIGLTGRQIATVAFAMNDLNRGIGITEKLMQSVINFITLGRITRGPFRTSDAFKWQGTEIIDPTRVYYYGASLGGNMGGVFMAYDPDITLGVLGVAGGPWSLLFERSLAWPPLRIALQGSYNQNPWDYQQNMALMGWMFEKVDPITTAHRVLADPLPDTPAKQLLVYMGMGDTLVTNISSDVLVRSLDIPICGPSIRVPFGVIEELAPASSAATIYDENVTPWPPTTNVAPDDDNGTHGDVNERAAVQRQVTHFIENAEVINGCLVNDIAVPCDCSTGACD